MIADKTREINFTRQSTIMPPMTIATVHKDCVYPLFPLSKQTVLGDSLEQTKASQLRMVGEGSLKQTKASLITPPITGQLPAVPNAVIDGE